MMIQKKQKETAARIYPDTLDRFKQMTREMQAIEKQEIKMSELFRRVSNIPNLKNIILEDSMNKMRRRKWP